MESVVPEFEELMLCGYCKQKFNETDQSPKLLSCKHYFCLQCMRTALNKGQDLFCVHCWKRTELGEVGPEALPTYTPVLCLIKKFSQMKLSGKPPDKKVISENCHTHAMPLALWCVTCGAAVCRACATTSDHATHQIKSQNEAKDQLVNELQSDIDSIDNMLKDTQKLYKQQREFMLKVLEACISLKQCLEAELTSNVNHLEILEICDAISKIRMSLATAETPNAVHNLYASFTMEKHRLQMRYHDMYLQCQLDELVRNSNMLLDYQLLKQGFNNLHNGGGDFPVNSRGAQPNPYLILANYCITQMYNRSSKQMNGNNLDYHSFAAIPPQSYLQNQHLVVAAPKTMYHDGALMPNMIHSPQLSHRAIELSNRPLELSNRSLELSNRPLELSNRSLELSNRPLELSNRLDLANRPLDLANRPLDLANRSLDLSNQRNPINLCPLFYFNIEVNGAPLGRIVIEVRADVAPKMAKNFSVLTTGEAGMGYKGCSIFQCWEGESVITGDFELHNGRGGRSVYEDSFFLPDDTKLLAVRGTVGMRRTQKRHDNMGMVGSQFRIILQEMRGFSGIFGHVVEGLELVEKISTYGDTTGKPTKNIMIAKCGKL